MTLYVRIPNYIEVKRNLLEIKKDIYLMLYDSLKILQQRKERIRLLNEIRVKITEIEKDIKKLKELLPREELKKIKNMEEIKKEIEKREKEIEEIKVEVEKRSETKDELELIEEELKKIEEELKALL